MVHKSESKMETKAMPAKSLFNTIDGIEHKNSECMFNGCDISPINSHVIPENYLYKLDRNLKQIVMLQRKMLPRIVKDESMLKVSKEKFSTFHGFCQKHDAELFKEIDLFDGKVDKRQAALVHYKNICYGVWHIKTYLLKIKHTFQQKFVEDGQETFIDKLAAKKFKDLDYREKVIKRLEFCLQEYESRKKDIENMLNSKEFEEIVFEVLPVADLDNPIFSGRSTPAIYGDNNYLEGYPYMPYVTYMTLVTEKGIYLIFCWLRKDKIYAKNLESLFSASTSDFRQSIAELAWIYSDFAAAKESVYEKHKQIIDSSVKSHRPY